MSALAVIVPALAGSIGCIVGPADIHSWASPSPASTCCVLHILHKRLCLCSLRNVIAAQGSARPVLACSRFANCLGLRHPLQVLVVRHLQECQLHLPA